MPDAFVVIIPEETLRGFTHPAIDLTSGRLVELEPAPEQLDLFTEALVDVQPFGEPLPATFEPVPDE